MQEQCPDINLCLTIPFQSAKYAALACDVLNVDKELKGSGVSRDISRKSENLVINLNGQDLKRLRVSANSMLKNVILITKTFSQFELN